MESHDTGFLCVPIILDSEVVGTLSADIPKGNAWPLEGHARVLGIVASLIAFDVKTRRLAELERHNLEVENERLRTALQERFRPDNMIGNSSMPPTLQLPDEKECQNLNSLTTRVELLERDMIVDALKSTRGNVAAAARVLSITPRIIRYKIKNLGIDSRRVCEKRV